MKSSAGRAPTLPLIAKDFGVSQWQLGQNPTSNSRAGEGVRANCCHRSKTSEVGATSTVNSQVPRAASIQALLRSSADGYPGRQDVPKTECTLGVTDGTGLWR